MKNYNLFFQLKRCTGCQLCVMACSLNRAGVCGDAESCITVLTDSKFGTSIPLIREGCLEADCKGECVEVCTPRVLKLADEELSHRLMVHPSWQPVPLLNKEKVR